MRKERFSQEIIEQIRNSVYLPDLVRKYTHLKRNKGLCPFHQEKHPSFSVDAQKGLWHCFGCGRGGDVFSFIMQAEGVIFPNAVKLLAFEASIRLSESESIKQALSNRWQQRQHKIDKLNYLEELFKCFENDLYEHFRLERQLLPKIKGTAKDYLNEQLIEYKLDILDLLVVKREDFFNTERKDIRNG